VSRASLVYLLLALGACSTTTAEQRRDLAIQTALDSARAACLILQSDKSIQREPGVDDYCAAVLNGCSK